MPNWEIVTKIRGTTEESKRIRVENATSAEALDQVRQTLDTGAGEIVALIVEV